MPVVKVQTRQVLLDAARRIVLADAGVPKGSFYQPAVVIEAPTFQYVAPQPGLFDYQIAFSDHPPLVTDFWNTSVAADGRQPKTHKGVHASATQFAVPVN